MGTLGGDGPDLVLGQHDADVLVVGHGGSPLNVQVSGTAHTLAVSTIAIAAAAVMTLLSTPLLKSGTSKTAAAPAPSYDDGQARDGRGGLAKAQRRSTTGHRADDQKRLTPVDHIGRQRRVR